MIFYRSIPTFSRHAFLGGDHDVHDIPPGALSHRWVAGGQIRARQLQVERRLFVRRISCMEQPLSDIFVFGLQAFLPSVSVSSM